METSEWRPTYKRNSNPDRWRPCWVLWVAGKPSGMVTRTDRGTWTWLTSSGCGIATLKQAKDAVEKGCIG